MTFIIFFSVFLAVYSVVNYYIFSRIWQVLPSSVPLRAAFIGISVFLSVAFIGGRVLERFKICTISDFTIWTGSFWLAFMLYLFMGFLIIDIVRLGAQLAPISRLAMDGTFGLNSFRKISIVVVVIIASLLVLAGHINAVNPRVRLLEIAIDKKTTIPALNIVMVSDIHCGTIIGNSRLEKMVSVINSLRPDIVLLAGDIVDEDLKPVIEQNIGETLKNIRTRDGVYAVTGNHEYIG
ncbi:MAG TPA: metallophosphoesterase, partial [Spirochaetes bacterium]|nr:metallophosphoesterase [Spirochaetota bacterium]